MQQTTKQPDKQMTNNMPEQTPVTVFFSYSHKDEVLRDKLATHLAILERSELIDAWHDRQIPLGGEWDTIIKDELMAADIILLLVSADFIASRYIWEVEIKKAMERHEAGNAIVIPIILRPCEWHDAPFGKLQALPKNAKAVTAFKDTDVPFSAIARKLKETVKLMQSRKTKAVNEDDSPTPPLKPEQPETVPLAIESTIPATTYDNLSDNAKLELDGLYNVEKLLIEKLNHQRLSMAQITDTNRSFELNKEIQSTESELEKIRQKMEDLLL